MYTARAGHACGAGSVLRVGCRARRRGSACSCLGRIIQKKSATSSGKRSPDAKRLSLAADRAFSQLTQRLSEVLIQAGNIRLELTRSPMAVRREPCDDF
jgi:hypothetical protein